MSPRPVFALLVLSAGLLALTGCASERGAEEAGPTAEAGSPVGTWRAEEPGTAWLEIADDGSVSGSDGCNRVNGRAEVSGDSVTFSMGFTTLIACPGVTIDFGSLASGTVADDILVTRDAAGTEIVALARSDS